MKHGQRWFGIRGTKHQDATRCGARPPHLIQRGAALPHGHDPLESRISDTAQQKRLDDAWIKVLNPLSVRCFKLSGFIWCNVRFQESDNHVRPPHE